MADYTGKVISMASILGSVGFSGAPAYVAAIHGVLGLTKAAAVELAPSRIRVIAVQPAFIHTPLITPEIEQAVLPLHPLGRLGESDEVATLVAWLGSGGSVVRHRRRISRRRRVHGRLTERRRSGGSRISRS